MLNDGDYAVEKFIGEGRFARVHRGYMVCKPLEKVAIRIIKVVENAALDKKKLLREAEELLKFQHVNIVRTYGILLDKNAFVQEYCVKIFQTQEIHSLLGLINILSDDFPTSIKLKCFADAASALTYLHSLKVVVGDLKPANILVTAGTKDDWIFKLADITPETRKRIGCSSAMSSCIQGKDNFTYTAVFLAPELLQFNPTNMNENKTTACDIYSFAIMMYQVLFPTTPLFEEMHPFQFMIAISNNWRPSIPSFSSALYKKLVGIMTNCWSNDPVERPKAEFLCTQFKKAFPSTEMIGSGL